jgi:hypothetical protein
LLPQRANLTIKQKQIALRFYIATCAVAVVAPNEQGQQKTFL